MEHVIRFAKISTVVILAGILNAQGILPLSGNYHTGILGSSFSSPCTPGAPLVHVTHGTTTFLPTGSWSMNASMYQACPGQSFPPNPSNAAGSYSIDGNSIGILDSSGATQSFWFRPDGSLGVSVRTENVEKPGLTIVLQHSSGQTTAGLSGAFHVVRMTKDNRAAGLTSWAGRGTITFDGAGGWQETGHGIQSPGPGTLTPYNSAGTYQVAANGALSAGSSTYGGISANREFFFWVAGSSSSTTVGMTLGVRVGSGLDTDTLAGPWGFVGHHLDFRRSHGLTMFTEFDHLRFQAWGPTTGAVHGAIFCVDTWWSTTSNPPQVRNTADLGFFSGTFQMQANGAFVIPAPPATAGLPGAVSPSGTVLIGVDFDVDSPGLFLGVRPCPWPLGYGLGTLGTNGLAPRLDGAGGFPNLGNANFQIELRDGLPGATGAIALSSGRSAGSPMSGMILWIDPTQLLAFVSVPITGTGVGTLPLPIPASPTLDGRRLFAQGFVFEPSGVVSTSGGLQIELGR